MASTPRTDTGARLTPEARRRMQTAFFDQTIAEEKARQEAWATRGKGELVAGGAGGEKMEGKVGGRASVHCVYADPGGTGRVS